MFRIHELSITKHNFIMSSIKKLSGVLTGVLTAATIFGFVMLPSAQALTQTQVDAILSLLSSFGAPQSTINDVNAALNGQPTSGSGSSSSSSCDTYGTSAIVKVGHKGENVKAIQRAMNQILDLSNGSMTPLVVDGIFGPLTKGVVQYFQGIIGTTPDGIWGPNTQAAYLSYVANNCDSSSNNNSGNNSNPGVGAGDLDVVSMNGGKIATGGNANVFGFEISAGEDDLEIDDITFKRYGNSVNSNWENFKVVDENGVAISNTGASLNSSNKVKLSFTPNLMIKSGESAMFYLRAGVDSLATNGQTAMFGIDSMDDIDFVGSPDVDGSFPAQGPSFEVLTLSIGSLTVAQDGTTPDTTPDVGDTDVILNKFKVTAGSNESVTIEQIQVEKKGSASSDDIANIELYDVTNGQTVATVSGWDARGLATFNNLNMNLLEGKSVRFQIRADIVSGTGLTVNADITDGSDVRVVVKGDDYGYYITPTAGSFSNSGQGSSNQTISGGGVTIAKASETPATGNITEGSERLLGVFDLIVTGEEIQVSSFQVNVELTENSGSALSFADVTNVVLKNYTNGDTLAGPNDAVVASTPDGKVIFTDTMDFPVGTTKVAVYADLGTDFEAADQIYVTAAGSNMTVKGFSSNDSITATGSATGNTLTLNAGSLTSTTLTTPVAQNVALGVQDFVWAQFDFSASGSGEDVEISDITIAAAVADAAAVTDLDSVELWADLNSSNSSRGDAFETKISDTKNMSAATLAFTLNSPLVVAKDSSVRVAVVADLSSSASTDGSGDTYTVDLSAVTATGADTGDSISSTPSGSGQAMTSQLSGTLVVSLDSSSPLANVLLDGGQNGMQTLAIFRLTAGNIEDVDLDSMVINATGSEVDTYQFQAVSQNGSNIGSAVSVTNTGTTATVNWPSGAVTVPKNGYIKVVVKGTTRQIVAASSILNNDSFAVAIDTAGDVDGTGRASGSAINSTGTAVGRTMKLFESYPTFEWQTVGNTTLSLNPSHLVGRLKITANGNEDITFESGNGNKIVYDVTIIGDDTDTATELFTIKADGVTLDNTATVTSASGTSLLELDFSESSLTIPAGMSKTVEFYFDSSDLEDASDRVFINLNANTAGNLDFGVNGADFTNAVADVLWRSDRLPTSSTQTHVYPS